MELKEILTLIAMAIIVAYCLKFFPRQKPRMVLSFIIDDIKIKGVIQMIQLKATQKQKFKVEFQDAKGNVATVQPGTVSIAVENESVAAIVRDADDETKFEVFGGEPGTTQLNVSADADLGDGIKTVSDFSAVEVRAGDAVGVGIVALSEPEDLDVPE